MYKIFDITQKCTALKVYISGSIFSIFVQKFLHLVEYLRGMQKANTEFKELTNDNVDNVEVSMCVQEVEERERVKRD